MKTLIASILILSVTAHSEERASSKLTDLAAISIQDQGIKKLESLLKKYRGSHIEADLLSRLGDLYLERSGISFRVSEGGSVESKKKLYTQSLSQAVLVLSELISKHPAHIKVVSARFKRGKAYKELKQIDKAKADFDYLVARHSDFIQIDSALNDLIDFAQDSNRHEEALRYAEKLEAMPQSDFHPIGLHKAAWSYFNLNRYQEALVYLKKEIDHYLTKLDGKTGIQTETAFMESAYMDLSLFYFEAMNKKKEFASIAGAVKLFHEYDSTQKYFGPVVLKFARLLKAYTMVPELGQLREILVKNDRDVTETSDVVLMQLQYFYDRRDWASLDLLLKDLKLVRSEANQERIEKALTNTLADLHKLVLKNKASTEIGTLLKPLEHLTRSFVDIVGDKNPVALMAVYSLAETFFQLARFKEAAQEYARIADPELEEMLVAKKLPRSTLYLRMVSARFQDLKRSGAIPEKVKPKSFDDALVDIEKSQKSNLKEWLEWVDTLITLKTTPTEAQSVHSFHFEALKLNYVHIDREKAVEQLKAFGLTHAASEEGPLALTLALDTYSLNQDWNAIIQLSEEIEDLKGMKTAFLESVRALDATSKLKLTLAEKDPEKALDLSEDCLESHGSKAIKLECSLIHAKSLVTLKENEKAEKELSRIMDSGLDESHTKIVLLLRAQVRNELLKKDLYIEDLHRYLTITRFQDEEMTRQVVEHQWHKADPQFYALIERKEVCKGKVEELCAQYRTLAIIDRNQEDSVSYQTAYKNSTKAEPHLRAIWAVIALKQPKKRAFQDRLVLLQRLASSYDDLKPVFQVHLYPIAIKRISETVESIRKATPTIARLTSDPQTIERRMKLMQDIDLAFSKLMKMNWMEVKYRAMTELVSIYEGLYADLKKIETPEELLKPFAEKVDDLKKSRSELQEMAFELSPKTEVEELLLSSAVRSLIPSEQWEAWKDGVKKNKRDYLLHLIQAQDEDDAAVLKALVLLMAGAQSEAYTLIESSSSSVRSHLMARFQRRETQ